LSIAIVKMVMPKNLHHFSNSTSLDDTFQNFDHSLNRSARSVPSDALNETTIAPDAFEHNLTHLNDHPEIKRLRSIHYDWDDNVQGLVLSSYFYGYLLLQVTGGRVC